MKRLLIALTAMLTLLVPRLALAQVPNAPFGTCSQYQPGAGGDFCVNNGSVSYWQQFTGDVVNDTRATPQCSPGNISACGHLKVLGLDGILFNGSLVDGQAWCYNQASNTMIPCVAGGGSNVPLGTNGQVIGYNASNIPTAYTPFSDVVVDPATYAFSVHHWFLTSAGDTNDQLIDDIGGLVSNEDTLAEHDINNFSLASSCSGINPKDPFYGAVGDGATDDTAALQKAYLAAAVQTTANNTNTLCIPAGKYATTFPLIFQQSPASASLFPRIQGAGGMTTVQGQTILGTGSTNNTFPLAVVIPNDYVTRLGTIATAPLVGATGHSLQFNSGGTKDWGLILNETPMVGMNSATYATPINGLSDLLIQFYFTTTDTTGFPDLITSSSGVGNQNDGAFNLYFAGSGNLNATMNIGGVLKTVPGAGTVTANTTYWVALELDSTNHKIWTYLCTPGHASCAPLSSVAATGTILENAAEHLALGGVVSDGWPSGKVGGFHGQVYSVDIENVSSLHGATITAPSTAFTFGANTLYGNNFIIVTPTTNGVANTPFVSVDYLNGAAQANAWEFIWEAEYDGNARGIQISDLLINGGTIGLLDVEAPQSFFHNITINHTGYGAFWAGNNTYNSIVDTMYINQLYGGDAFGFGCGWGLGIIRGLSVDGGLYGIASSYEGCGALEGPIITGGTATISDMRLGQGSSSFSANSIYDASCDNENGGNSNCLELTGGGGMANLYGGNYLSTGTGVPILLNGSSPSASITGTRLFPSAGSAADIDFIGSGSPASVTLHGVTTSTAGGGTAALTNRPDLVSSLGGGVLTVPSIVANSDTVTQHNVTNYSVNGVFNVKDPFYGATGSATHETATTNGTTAVTLSAAGDFVNGQHVTLAHASIVSSAGAPSFTVAPMSTDSSGFNTVSGCSTWNSITCSTTWRYEIFAIDSKNGWTGPSSIQQTTVGPSTLSPWDINRLTVTTSANDVGYAIYRCTGTACTSWALTGAAIVTNAPMGGSRPATILWDDFGSTVSVPVDNILGTSPPAGNLNQDLHTTIVSGAPGTTIVVANTATTTGPYEMTHDDAPAFQAAITAACNNNGGKVQVPAPGEYHLGSTLTMLSCQGVIVSVDQQPGGATGASMGWNGSIVGTEIFMDGSASNTIENWTTFPLGSRGNSAGIVVDMDKVNGSMATTSNIVRSGRFFNAAIGVRLGNVSATNDDLMTVENGTFSQNYYGLYLNTTLGDRFNRNTFSNSAYGIYMPSGSYSARDTNMGGNVVDFFIGTPNGPITIDGGTIDHGGYKNLKIDTPTAESGLIPITFENMRIYNQNPSYDGSSTNDVIIADRNPSPLILSGNTWKQGSNLAQAANMKIVATQSSGVNTQVVAMGNIYHNATPYSGSANINLTQCNESYANAAATLAVPLIEGCSTTNFIAAGIVAETPCRSALTGNNNLTASCAHSFYTLNGSGTETLPAGTYDGQNWSLTFCATGAFTPTIGPATGANAVSWPAAGAPAFTATNAKCDEISGYWDATNSRWAMWPVALGRAIAP